MHFPSLPYDINPLTIAPCGPFGPRMPFGPKSPEGPCKQQQLIFKALITQHFVNLCKAVILSVIFLCFIMEHLTSTIRLHIEHSDSSCPIRVWP